MAATGTPCGSERRALRRDPRPAPCCGFDRPPPSSVDLDPGDQPQAQARAIAPSASVPPGTSVATWSHTRRAHPAEPEAPRGGAPEAAGAGRGAPSPGAAKCGRRAARVASDPRPPAKLAGRQSRARANRGRSRSSTPQSFLFNRVSATSPRRATPASIEAVMMDHPGAGQRFAGALCSASRRS